MKCGNGRLIYDGVKEKLNGKIAFMEAMLRYKQVQEDIAKVLAEDEELREKLPYLETPMKHGRIMRFDLMEEDLELVFDALVKGRLKAFMEGADLKTQVLGAPLAEGEKEVEIDITYFVLNAIIANALCRKKLEEEVTERSEYYDYWEKSKYNYPDFEACVPVENIWNFRLLVGIVEKLRKEEERGQTYRLFMNIIYAGNGELKRQIKRREHIAGGDIKEIFGQEIEQNNNVFPVKCKIMLLLVMADDMHVPVLWDYEMMTCLQFYEEHQDEKEEDPGETEQETDGEKTEHTEFLEKFNEKYGTYNSLTDLAVSEAVEELSVLLFDVMNLYQLSPRKFHAYKLTDQECHRMLGQSERWGMKKYRYFLVIANLCKYIQHIEQKYLNISKDCKEFQHWKAQQAASRKESREKQYQAEIARLNAEKKQMAETILKQEQQLSKLQNQLEQQEVKLQERMQELGALRSYVYLTGNGDDDLSEKTSSGEDDGQMDSWKEKKVLVVGGHVNWQNKLKERFPQWQFLSAGQSSLVKDLIKSKEIIVCNTEILDHSCYYKVIAEKNRNQKLLYVHSNNIQKCILELMAQKS